MGEPWRSGFGGMEHVRTGIWPPILISLTCTLRSDQCLTALGRHNRRKKFQRLYARMNRDSLTRLATNRRHDSRVQFRAYLPSLIHCSAVPRPL